MRAHTIIMSVEISTNLIWELSSIRQNNLQEKLFLLTPSRRKIASKNWLIHSFKKSDPAQTQPETTWQEFARLINSLGYSISADTLSHGTVVGFDATANAHALVHDAFRPEEFVSDTAVA